MLKKIVLSLVSCAAFNVSCALPALDTKLGERAAAGAPGVAGSVSVAGNVGVGQPSGGAAGAAGVAVAGAPMTMGGASNFAGAEGTAAGSGNTAAGTSSLTAAGATSIVAGAGGRTSVVSNGGAAGRTIIEGTGGSIAGEPGRGGASSGGASRGGAPNGGAAGTSVQVAGASGSISAAGTTSTVVTSPPPGCEGDLTYANVMATAIRNAVGIASTVPITWARVKDLKELKIKSSECASDKLPNLNGIECLTSLQTLSVGDCQLKDITALGKSVRETPRRVMPITNLNLSANPLTDLSPIAALEELVSLGVSDIYQQTTTRVPLSIAVVKSLTKLQNLYASTSAISSISGLENHPTLVTIDLESNDLTSVAGLGELKQLKKILLGQNVLTSADGLGDLPALEEMNIYNQKTGQSLKDINALANPKIAGSLKILNISYNSQLQSFAALSTFTALTSLDARACSFLNTVGLSGAVNLTTLNLASNELESITELAGLVNLATLDLSNNSKLADITPLVNNPGLTGSSDKITLSGTALGTTAGCLAATESLKALVNPPRSVTVTLSPKCI